MMYDDDEAFCDGDPTLDEIDWDRVAVLQQRYDEALALPDDDRPLVMLELLHELHGDDLQVL